MDPSYDYVIVGAGSAGCVMANRLSAKSANRVLLIEAGRDTSPGAEPKDILDTYPMSYYNLDYAWREIVAHGRTRDNSPAVPMRQGRVMGGSSSIMGMVALRGIPDDYDEWTRLGLPGWSWDDVLPYFKRIETDIDFDGGAMHGADGPVPVHRLPRDDWPPFVRAVRDWAHNRQIPDLADMNGEFREGIGALPLSRFPEKRASSAICYLDAAVRARPNLTILAETTVRRLTFEGARVTGVVAQTGSGERTFSAGEVIVCAGALQSPVMLMRNGIGPAGMLRSRGLPVVADLPGVGTNLQNHQVVYVVAQLRRAAAQPLELKSHTIASTRYSSNIAGCPPLDMALSISSKTGWHALGRRIGALVPGIFKPASRGQIELARDPAAPALIEFDYLSDERDRVRMVDGVRRAIGVLLSPEVRGLWHCAFPVSRAHEMRRLNDITAMNALRARMLAGLFDVLPAAGRPILGRLTEPGVDIATLMRDEAALDALVRTAVTGVMHPVGTCRMGPAEAREAVTDGAGRVHGVAGLRVVDASIMPVLPRANTNFPTMMLAEKISAATLAAGAGAAYAAA